MKLSIIIPIYNSEKYIEACLKSCLAQDFDDYEIICVDDGSTDLSYHICQQYVQNNLRIRVIKKENGGVSSARNKGIEEAKGEWIWFVDSDDMVLRNCISYLYSCVAIGGEYDLLMFDIKRVNDPIEEQWNTLSPDVISLDGIELFTKFPKYSYGNSPFTYWFKKSIIAEERIEFDDSMKYAEDTKFIFEYKMSCKKGVMLDLVCYYYI